MALASCVHAKVPERNQMLEESVSSLQFKARCEISLIATWSCVFEQLRDVWHRGKKRMGPNYPIGISQDDGKAPTYANNADSP